MQITPWQSNSSESPQSSWTLTAAGDFWTVMLLWRLLSSWCCSSSLLKCPSGTHKVFLFQSYHKKAEFFLSTVRPFSQTWKWSVPTLDLSLRIKIIMYLLPRMLNLFQLWATQICKSQFTKWDKKKKKVWIKINGMDGIENYTWAQGTKVICDTSYLCNLMSKNNVMGWIFG